MAIKKSQLYSSIWQSCDELRGGMDASQYKDYILTLLFMKYVTDKYAGNPDGLLIVPEGGGFDDMVALKGNKDIGEKINIVIRKFAEANELKGVIDQADFNDETKLGSGKDMQDRLSKLVSIFDRLDLGANRAEGDDLMGDAYEFLMRHFATESGKSKGQFYTPAEVSTVMAKVVGIGSDTRQDQTVYDPTCGSGSLLLKAANEAPNGLSIFGQENDNATWALSKMNMILHDYPTAEIWRDNTLSRPYFKDSHGKLARFDFSVANPPFSAKSWTNGLDPANDEFRRFEYGTPPAKNGDYAFLLHLIASLKSTGKGAIILPHGVLFRGHKEAEIRKNLIKRGFIKGIIGLPANLFYGTGIPACIIVIDKETAREREGIFMIDASKGYIKDGNKNRLRSQDIHKIVDVFNKNIALEGYSRMVPFEEIEDPSNDYNLNIPRYIDSSEPEDLHDLEAHLYGGIPEKDVDNLKSYWQIFPNLKNKLFKNNGREGYLEPKVGADQIRTIIFEDNEFKKFSEDILGIINQWEKAHKPLLYSLEHKTVPKEIIHTLSEDLLKRFSEVPLINKYDVYQQLMDYWYDVMQDDIYLITAVGWKEAAQPRSIINDKERKIQETADLTINKQKYKTDLIPPELLKERFFKEEKDTIDNLQTEEDAATREFEEFTEEHTEEDGLLEDVVNDKGNITKKSVEERLKKLSRNMTHEFEEEKEALHHCLKLLDKETKAKKALKDAQAKLDKDVFAKYFDLTEDEIKLVVINDKWFGSIREGIQSEINNLAQQLIGRIQKLNERYSEPLPEIEKEVSAYNFKVKEHLKKMGVL